jgi:hypothetical protein
MSSCSICLQELKVTRHTPHLKCNHFFHQSCIEKWKKNGGNTCPLCRKEFSPPRFRATLFVEDLRLETQERHEINSQVLTRILHNLGLSEEDIANLSSEFSFDVNTHEQLHEILTDLGVPH